MVSSLRAPARAAVGALAAGALLLGAGAGAAPAQADVLPAPAALVSPPNDLVGTTPVDTPAFSWSAVTGAVGYELQLSEDDRFLGAKSVLTAVPAFTPTASLAQDQYFWRVRALKGDGTTSAWTAPFGFRREWTAPSPAGDPDGAGLELAARPLLKLPTGAQLPADQLTLSWMPVRGASYYVVDISTDPGFSSASSPSSPARRTCRTAHTTFTPYGGAVYAPTKRALFDPCNLADPVAPFLATGTTYFVRVRAVDETPDGRVVTSLWSDAARPGPAASTATPGAFTVAAPTRIPTSAGLAAFPKAPFPASPTGPDAPVLEWQPVAGAQAYLVGLAKDSSFNTSLLDAESSDLRTDEHWVTTNTELITNQPLLDNTVTSGFFWFALPCSTYMGPGDPANVCVGSAQAINTPQHYGSFTKRAVLVGGLTRVVDAANTVTFLWSDQGLTSPDGGGIQFYELEVRDGAGSVVEDVKTDNVRYVRPNGAYPDGSYSWRVRTIDASGVPQEWTAGEPFTTKTPAAPATGGTAPGAPGAPTTPAAPGGAAVPGTTADAVATTLKGTQAIAIGRSADIAGTVLNAAGAPLSGIAVTVQVQPAGSRTWRKVATAKTASDGGFAAVVTPSRSSRYRAVVGTRVVSPSIRVSVVPALTLKASARRVALGDTLTFSGVLKPKGAAGKVALQCRRGTRWVTLTSARPSAATGAFRLRLKVTSAKAGRCRATVATSPAFAGARSREATFTVR